MNKRLENWLLKSASKQFAGVEMVAWGSTPIFHIVVLEIVKEEVITVDKMIDCQGFEELTAFFKRLKNAQDIPIHLVLSQRGIIHKQVDFIDKNPLQQVLPNAKATDFYYQVFEPNNIISVVRLEVIQEILTSFEKEKYAILNISLGDFGVYHLLPFIAENETIQTATQIHHYEQIGQDFKLKHFQKSNEDVEATFITLGEEKQDNRLLGAFAGGFDGLMLQSEQLQELDLLENIKAEFIQKQLFKISGMAILTIFFVALLVNFLLFANYTDKNQILQMQVNLQQSTLQQLDSLEKEVEGKQAFLKNNTLNQLSKKSYYADEIAQTLPNDIQLTTLNIFPKQKEKRSTENKLPQFNQEIIIKGKTKETLSFNEWKQALENLDWIQKVNIIGFGEEDGVSIFELLIEL